MMNYVGTFIAALALTSPAMAQENADHNNDYRTFTSGGIAYGQIGDSYTADLVMYLAGNQFMVIEDLITDFQGQILKGQLLQQGQINGEDTAQNPDLYASVNLGHLKKLSAKGMMENFIIYTHNKLELMVAAGNPMGITGPEDLARTDIVQSHPNPLTEGIFKFYGSQMLRDLGIYEQVTGNAECKSCWAIEGQTWFTSRHHRETPQRIEDGEADVGIVWATEVVYGMAEGRPIEGVAIEVQLNQQSRVGYAIGALTAGRNQANAQRFLDYLGTDGAQAIYASHGFISATTEELTLKPIPAAN